ncbi:MAG: phage holin family protein [Nocardioidaceae bacterium]|nr:MAG: phage holin family protein [Nocardioidaceae bacterium]
MTVNNPTGGRHAAPDDQPDPSVGGLVATALEDVSSLVRSEIDLVKTELTVSVKNGGLAAALVGAAVFFLLIASVMLSMAFAYLLHMTGLHVAWCFLIVFGAYALIAAVLLFVAYKRVRFVRPPKRAIEQAKETKEALLNRR